MSFKPEMRWLYQMTPEQIERAQAEVDRVNREKSGYKTDYTVGSYEENGFTGAAAEYVSAILLGKPFKGYDLSRRKEGDVGGFEVRSTDKPHYGLAVNIDDNIDRPFMLVKHLAHRRKGLFHFEGWHFGFFVRMRGRKYDQRHRQPDGSWRLRPYWTIPSAALLPMHELLLVNQGVPYDQALRGWVGIQYLRSQWRE